MKESAKPSHDRDIDNVEPALKRAAKKALKLGQQNNAPVYVWKNGMIVDLTKNKE